MEYQVFLVIIVAFMAVMTIVGRVNEKRRLLRQEKQCRDGYGRESGKKYGDEELHTIPSYYVWQRKLAEAEASIDDITWNDLGMDEVFYRLDYTGSSAGEQFLYYMLRSPRKSREELDAFEERIRTAENSSLRVALQMQFLKIGRSGKYSIWDYLELLDNLGERSNFFSFAVDAWIILMIPVSIFAPGFGVMGLIGGILFNFIRYFREKAEVEPYIISFSYLMRLLEASGAITKTIDKCGAEGVVKADAQELSGLVRKFNSFRRNSYLILSPTRMAGGGDPLDLLLDYMRMIFHLDLMKFNQMLKTVRVHIDEVEEILRIVGRFDAAVSVNCYRAYLNQQGQVWCIPEFTGQKELVLREGYHPLIESPVANSISTRRNVLITGSNASGKSTFLKMVAINALLAQSVHTVLASEYRGCFYRIYSSMALRDDLLGGESYYMVEIRSLKRIIDAAKEDGIPVLCFVDEVLRGTNTVERIAASVEIMRYLSGLNLLCFTATHDIELTRLLREGYDNYHFSEEFGEGEEGMQGGIHFTYLLQNGEATSRNAIRLLDLMGFEKEITERAERKAEEFLEKGKWQD